MVEAPFFIGENEYIVIISIVFIIGFIQAAISTSSILRRFDRRRRGRIRIIAVMIVIIFILFAFTNIERFTDPQKLPEIQGELPQNWDDVKELSENLIGEDKGLWGGISIAVPIIVFLLGRIGRAGVIARRFLTGTSIIAFLAMAFVILTNYVPSESVVNLYLVYQAGIMIGAVLGSGIMEFV